MNTPSSALSLVSARLLSSNLPQIPAFSDSCLFSKTLDFRYQSAASSMSVNAPQKIFHATFFNPKDCDFLHFEFVQIFSCLRLKHELGSVMQKCTIKLPGDRG